MARIPSKTKTNSSEDNNVSLEVAIMIFAFVLIGNKILENKVHSSLQWFLLLLIIVLVVFLILPNSKNHGKNGYQRMLIWLKYVRYRR